MSAVQLLEQDDARQLVGQSHLAEGEAMVDLLEFKPERPADHEAEITSAAPSLLEKARELQRIRPLPVTVKQRDEGPVGQPASNAVVLAHLDELEARMAGEELLVVLYVVGEWGT